MLLRKRAASEATLSNGGQRIHVRTCVPIHDFDPRKVVQSMKGQVRCRKLSTHELPYQRTPKRTEPGNC
jgi:hypothetical protein